LTETALANIYNRFQSHRSQEQDFFIFFILFGRKMLLLLLLCNDPATIQSNVPYE